MCRLHLLRANAHISGDTCWDALVSPLDEPAQEFFSWRAGFVSREMSGMAFEWSEVCNCRAVVLVLEDLHEH